MVRTRTKPHFQLTPSQREAINHAADQLSPDQRHHFFKRIELILHLTTVSVTDTLLCKAIHHAYRAVSPEPTPCRRRA